MLLIPCPNCGERDESEFHYGGRSARWPDLAAPTAQWHQAVHLNTGTRSPVRETWYHFAGCECWIELIRDLQSHAFTYPPPGDDP